jgi:hypothetical protein
VVTTTGRGLKPKVPPTRSDNPDIAWRPSFAVDQAGLFTNNTGYFLPIGDPWIAAVLNAPIGWWFAWRKAQHGKDEALRYFNTFVEEYPIAQDKNIDVQKIVASLASKTDEVCRGKRQILNWLNVEFGLDEPGSSLVEIEADAFVAAVRQALPKSRKLSVSEIERLKKEHATTLGPARKAARDALLLERRLSDLVNAAYGLTPDEVKLMWDTAPPRMPIPPAV